MSSRKRKKRCPLLAPEPLSNLGESGEDEATADPAASYCARSAYTAAAAPEAVSESPSSATDASIGYPARTTNSNTDAAHAHPVAPIAATPMH